MYVILYQNTLSLLLLHGCVARRAMSSSQQLSCLLAQLLKSKFFSSSDESWELYVLIEETDNLEMYDL